ncbi:multicopper oxidase LPR1 homolog 3-like [Selaginella moellendorffii]|uniref:multicopper oxidase LPR1 homolog 3-like n=1 Tax=Selaginella moellendorffii TaxID=88036 RepID=UPI000D1C61E4|nr:multicopper oxidase LPR1 homolog 3-like [Selaginella moellendorffii]|eukprot:XP_024531685.1 multicopper oxidase LPR1 homolog 3-like [Selaginella moellendorffii]
MILAIQLLVLLLSHAVQATQQQQQHVFSSNSRPPEVCLNLTPSPTLEKFVDRLPRLPTISLVRYPRLTMGAYKIYQSTASYPGPTLVARQGVTATVRWENHIRDYEHMLPVDKTLQWVNPRHGFVPVVVHNHGQETEGWSDGHPEAWFTVTGEHGDTYVTQDYVYPNDQRPTMLWYHDHTLGITRLNVAAGLAGAYVIEPSSEMAEPSWVPRDYHVLVVQDKAFYDDGSIKYPTVGLDPDVHPQWCVEYLGDVVLVNGVVWPFMEVEPAIYRFRLVNAANARTFVLETRGQRMSFIKIGTDGAMLHQPVQQQQMRVGPAERVDWLFDFSSFEPSDEIELWNVGQAPFPIGPPANQSVMLFRVVSRAPDRGSSGSHLIPTPLDPSRFRYMAPVDLIGATTGVNLSFVPWAAIYSRGLEQRMTDLALSQDDHLLFDDPVREIIRLYSTEVWSFINFVPVAHFMHLHLVNFFVLEQQPFDPDRVANGSCTFGSPFGRPESCYTAYPTGPDEDQVGFKDTTVSLPFYVTQIFVRFAPNLLPRYRIDPTAYPGYTHHCHLLEHEDNEMMRPMLMSRTTTLYPNESFPLDQDIFFLTITNWTVFY